MKSFDKLLCYFKLHKWQYWSWTQYSYYGPTTYYDRACKRPGCFCLQKRLQPWSNQKADWDRNCIVGKRPFIKRRDTKLEVGERWLDDIGALK